MKFESFFQEEYGSVVRALALAIGDSHAAEDAAQEAFAKALNRWPRVGAMDRPAAWVYVVALRHHRRRFRPWPLSRPGDSPAPDVVSSVTDRMVLTDLLADLAPRQRAAVVLRFVADLPLADVASALGCRVGTVKATIHQALAALRDISKEVHD